MNKYKNRSIPEGPYCYDEKGSCPYYRLRKRRWSKKLKITKSNFGRLMMPEEMAYGGHNNCYMQGYCALLKRPLDVNDQVKDCGMHESYLQDDK